MTVTCNRCGSRFDVDDMPIPPSGRLVVCRHCGTAVMARPDAVSPAGSAAGGGAVQPSEPGRPSRQPPADRAKAPDPPPAPADGPADLPAPKRQASVSAAAPRSPGASGVGRPPAEPVPASSTGEDLDAFRAAPTREADAAWAELDLPAPRRAADTADAAAMPADAGSAERDPSVPGYAGGTAAAGANAAYAAPDLPAPKRRAADAASMPASARGRPSLAGGQPAGVRDPAAAAQADRTRATPAPQLPPESMTGDGPRVVAPPSPGASARSPDQPASAASAGRSAPPPLPSLWPASGGPPAVGRGAAGSSPAPDLAGELPGLADLTDDELGAPPTPAAPIVDLPVPRGFRAGPTGSTPPTEPDESGLLAPKGKMPSRAASFPSGVALASRGAPAAASAALPSPTGPHLAEEAPFGPGAGDDGAAATEDTSDLLGVALELDEDLPASQPRLFDTAHGLPPLPGDDVPLQLDTATPVAPGVIELDGPLGAAATASGEQQAPGRDTAGHRGLRSPGPRLGRVLLVAGGAAVVLAMTAAVLVSFTSLGEPLRSARTRRENVARAIADARRLLGDDTVTSYRKAAAALHHATEIDGRAVTPRALEAQAHLAVALLGFHSEVQLAERALGELKSDPTPGDANELAKVRALRALVGGNVAEAEAALRPLQSSAARDAAVPAYLGWIHLAAREPAQALGDFQRALAIEPQRAQALYGLGRAQEAIGSAPLRTGALASYRQALAASPSHLGAALGIERLQAGDAAESEVRIRDLIQAEGASAGPRDLAEAWTLLAWRARDGGRLAEAEDRYRKAIAIHPLTATSVALARVLIGLHRPTEAVTLLEPLMKAQERDGTVLLAMAEAQLDAGQLREATRTLAQAEALAPRAQSAWLKGRIEESRGGFGADGRAAALYQEAVAADPSAVDAWLALSRVLARAGRTADAHAALAQAEAKASADPTLRDRLGEAYLAAGDVSKAEAAFRAVIAKAPELLSARFHLGETLERTGRLDEAAALYAAVAAAHKDVAGLAERRGRLALRQNRVADAVGFYREALAADSHPSPVLRAAVGEALLRAGQFDEARKQLEQATNEDDRCVAAWLGLARVALAQGRPDEADPAARRAVQQGGTAEAQLVLGRTAELLGHLSDARAAYALASRSPEPPVSVEGRIGGARVLVRAGAVKDALAEAQALAKEAPGRAEPLLVMGDCFEELNQGEKARGAYSAALARNPASAEAAFKVARGEAEAGHDKAAVALLDRALHNGSDKVPFAAEAYLLAGDLHRRLRERAPAVTAYRKFLELARPDAPERKDANQALELLEAAP